MERTNVSSSAPWEPLFGYSRAVKVGAYIFVAGTTATDEAGRVVGVGDVCAQTRQALLNIESALEKVNATLRDVVRTRIFVTRIADWREVARAHSEVFAEIRPAATLVEVSRLIGPDLLVEIEADAVVPTRPAAP